MNNAFWNTVIKSKVIVFIFLLAFSILIGISAYKGLIGEHIKVFGFEWNIPKPRDFDHKDTAYAQTNLQVPKIRMKSGKTAETVSTGIKADKNSRVIAQNISGSNNHIVTGTHQVNGINQGINGDVTVVSEKKFTAKDEEDLIQKIDSMKRDGLLKKDCFIISRAGGSPVVFNQIGELLVKKGYKVSGISLQSSALVQGIELRKKADQDCFEVFVGPL